LKTEIQRLKNSMTFGGLISDPLRGAVNHNGQLLMPEQIQQVESNDELLRLRAKVQELQRDKQFLKEQVELMEDDIPDDVPQTELVRSHNEEKNRLEAVIGEKNTQLGRIHAVNRIQQARILELNRRLGIGQPRQPDRMSITQHHIDQLFDFSGQQFNGQGFNGNNDDPDQGN
jgi:hypothetical protein